MKNLKIVGMGPGGKAYLTLQALDVLTGDTKVILRTDKHPVVSYLVEKGMTYTSMDYIYDGAENFEAVYETIAEEIYQKSLVEPLVYAVPGNPFVAEKTVELLMEKAGEDNIEYIHGTSFIDAIITCIKKDPVHGLSIIDGLKIDEANVDVNQDALIIQVYDQMIASNIKLKMIEIYGDDHPVTIIRGAGIEGEEVVETVQLHEMDRLDIYDHLTSVYIDAPKEKMFHTFSDLVGIMKVLRSEEGCPWDRKQTHESLMPYLIEETYEVIDAIEKGDVEETIEELGDLLLQIVFHTTIAAEDGYYNELDVITGIVEKMINRHPHVFSDVSVEDADEVLVNWEAIKREEKNGEAHTDSMSRIPKGMPSLMRAYKVQKKAAEVGFDWPDISGAIEKIHEELDELLSEIKDGNQEKAKAELGDLLFAVVNVARFLKVRPELALNATIEKFVERFGFIEASDLSKAKGLANLTLNEMDLLWEEAKKVNNLR